MSKRAERRARTEAKKETRNKQYYAITSLEPRKPGMSASQSPFDCGNSNCGVCNDSSVDQKHKKNRKDGYRLR